jgi:hypothetical protein
MKTPALTQVQWMPVRAATEAFGVKMLAILAQSGLEHHAVADRRPPLNHTLSYLADAMAAANNRGPRYADVIRRLTNAMRSKATRPTSKRSTWTRRSELERPRLRDRARVWSGARTTRRWCSGSCAGCRRAKDGRWSNTAENATAPGRSSHYKVFERRRT